MAIPQPHQFSTPSRSVSEFTVGNADNKPDLSTAATSPTVGGLQNNPQFFQTIGVASQTKSLVTSAISAGAYGAVINNQKISFPSFLPSGTPITFGVNDQVWISAIIGSTTSIPVAGICVNAVQLTPFGVTTNNLYMYGPFLQTNIRYTSFGCLITIYAYCVNAVAANLPYVVRVDAQLLDLPG